MKKVFSCILVVLLLSAMSFSALAAGTTPSVHFELVNPAQGEIITDTSNANVQAATKAFDENKAELGAALAEADPALKDLDMTTLTFEGAFSFKAASEGGKAEVKYSGVTGKRLVLYVLGEDGNMTPAAVQPVWDAATGTWTYEVEDGVTYAMAFVNDPSIVAPATGESTPWLLLGAALVLAGCAVVFFTKSRKVA